MCLEKSGESLGKPGKPLGKSEKSYKKVPHPENQVRYFHMISFVVLYHADGQALTLQFLDSLTDGFVVLGGYA